MTKKINRKIMINIGLLLIFFTTIFFSISAQNAQIQHSNPLDIATDSRELLVPIAESDPITIILLDDIDWDTWNKAHKPNIDALEANGVSFSQAWAYHVCSPARAALLTGKHGYNTGIGKLIKPGATGDGLRLSEMTIAEVLEPETTDLFGKWHVGHSFTEPNEQGFRNYKGSPYNLVSNWGSNGYYDFQKIINGERTWVTGIYDTRDIFNDALDSDAANIYIQTHAVHSPYENPPGYDEQSYTGKIRASLEYFDIVLGELLEDRHDFDGTKINKGYIILTNDNGNDAKGTLKEGAVHVPFIIAGPGITPRVSDDLVSVVDIFPTIAELRGKSYPRVDGHSLVPILKGNPGTSKTIYTEKFSPNNILPPNPDTWEQAIMMKGYKLIRDVGDNVDSLYSMPGEKYIPESDWTFEDARAAQYLASQLPK